MPYLHRPAVYGSGVEAICRNTFESGLKVLGSLRLA